MAPARNGENANRVNPRRESNGSHRSLSSPGPNRNSVSESGGSVNRHRRGGMTSNDKKLLSAYHKRILDGPFHPETGFAARADQLKNHPDVENCPCRPEGHGPCWVCLFELQRKRDKDDVARETKVSLCLSDLF